jgi:two-component system LytT family response regulator
VTRLRAVIVDDERLARVRLRRMLDELGEVDVVAECSDGTAARVALLEHRPDVVFLDVQLPGGDGFSVLAELEVAPHVIFVTAHAQHAVRAFEVAASDFLLKPFALRRLAEALARLRGRPAGPPGMLVRDGRRLAVIRADQIDWIEAADNYIRIHRAGDEYLVRETLAAIARRLDGAGVVRVHRSFAVNLARIVELRALGHGELEIVLDCEAVVPLGRTYRDSLLSRWPCAADI